jgi:hypothetical protein
MPAVRKLMTVTVIEWEFPKSYWTERGGCGVLSLFLVTYVVQGDSHSCLAPTSLQLLQQIQASQSAAAAAAGATANGQPTSASLSALSTMQQQLLVQQQLQAAQNSAGLCE